MTKDFSNLTKDEIIDIIKTSNSIEEVISLWKFVSVDKRKDMSDEDWRNYLLSIHAEVKDTLVAVVTGKDPRFPGNMAMDYINRPR